MRKILAILLSFQCFLSSCKTTNNSARIASAEGKAPLPPNVSQDFIDAWRDYVSMYSKSKSSSVYLNNPDAKYAIFGDGQAPYEVQDFDPDASLASDDYRVKDDPNYDPGCAPTFVAASPEVPYQGTVVMFHGYTACPQQYYELARRLTKLGYHAIIPLLPGMGRAPTPASPAVGKPIAMKDAGAYYGAYIPTGAQWDRWQKYTVYINSLVALLPGRKQVVGLSGGAAVANYASIVQEGLYERGLFQSAFYQIPHSYIDQKLANRNGVLGRVEQKVASWVSGGLYSFQNFLITWNSNMTVSWGQHCYDQTRGSNGHRGRRGTCDFTAANLEGLINFGRFVVKFTADNASIRATWPSMQWVSVEFDTGADTDMERQVYQSLQSSKASDTSICFYRDIPHSSFSVADNPGLNMYWLPSYYDHTISYIQYGQFWPNGSQSKEYEGNPPNYYSLCRIPEADLPSDLKGKR